MSLRPSLLALVGVVLALAGAAPSAVFAQSELLGDPASARASSAASPDPVEPASPEPARGPRRYPGPVAARPLTLTAGRFRFGHGYSIRVGRSSFTPTLPAWAAIGATDDVEIGVSWPAPWDPTVYVLGRVLADDAVELGVAGSLTAPLTTDGNTVVRAAMPVLLRPFSWARVDTGVFVDVLVTPTQFSPEFGVPLTLTLQPVDGFFFGAQGSIAATDGSGRGYVASGGAFLGFTVITATGPVFEGRAGAHGFASGGFGLSVGFTFFPRLWD